MRWRRLGRKILRRPAPPHVSTPRWVWKAERADGKCWAGEYRWQGKTFTSHAPNIYYWGSEIACRAAIEAFGFANVRPVKIEFDRSVMRPQKRRVNHSRRR